MTKQVSEGSNINDENAGIIRKEAIDTIRIRKREDGPWLTVKLRHRGTLWAHVEDKEQKFRVQWKDVHPEDKFDYQQ